MGRRVDREAQRPRRTLFWLFATPTGLVLSPRLLPVLDPSFKDQHAHFWVVSGIAICALIVALAAAHSALIAREHGPVWLAVGCLAVAFFMVGHGIMTPVVHHRPFNAWIGRFPYLALLIFACSLFLAGLPRRAAPSRMARRRPLIAIGASAAVLGAFVLMLHLDPHRLHGARQLSGETAIGRGVGLLSGVLLVVMAATHWRRYRLGRDGVQLALVFASVMCTASIVSLCFGTLWKLSWWSYHLFLLAGFGGAVYAIAVRSRRSDTSRRLLDAAFEPDAMTHIVEGYPDALRTLVRAVELKDAYTAGHSQRTALVAIQLGLQMGLDADTLRAAAQGAYLHDVGKILVPDAILNKPGRLTPHEREVIERHPQSGFELVAPVPELHESLPAVLHHHERWDGTGYPTGLAERDIPLVARLVAVADVWDALTSDRSYRPGMPAEQALGHIVAGRGSHFDPAIVDAFVSLALDWGYQVGRGGDADAAWQAAESCHEVAVGANRS